uniref:UDP-glucose 4-epimerase n=1 Tax=Amorphochlora amoebiformis TaxID=1561963 RepID=A0A7S0CSF7_9EUKA|mmetsp:Transcript_12912/g.20415  ORF Transcript_12912/g.20415 Transcript_12912/m.20415 type:complete len:364 (+) Transcript_12912:75-1166(+)
MESKSKHILVTGGAGYIGSHTTVVLLQRGFKVTIVDNLDNSNEIALQRVEKITGKKPVFVKLDICDSVGLEKFFKQSPKFDACIHFAGLKAVGESVRKPMRYYSNNLVGTLYLLNLLEKYGCPKIIFSSSATVYGDPHKLPITEDFPLQPTNPYGQTKAMIEEMLKDVAKGDSGKNWKVIILRYFNPIGAHPSGQIGEDPLGIPNNLMPYIAQVAVGRRKELTIFGDDYDTKDGTGVRDYIHVVDLAKGHAAALEQGIFGKAMETNYEVYNLGSGKGISVMEMVKGMSKACGKPIPYKIGPRRAGDVAANYADPSKANKQLLWKCELGVNDMCADTWTWQSSNPKGYATTGETKKDESLIVFK